MDNIHNKTIGVIGYGNFGKVVCNYLFPQNKIFLYSSQKEIPDLSQNVSITNSLEDVVREVDIIVPAIPIREWGNVLQQIALWKKEQTTIIDILSVKEYSINTLQKYFSANQYIATHPMFGPASIRKNNNSIQGFTIVFCPTEKSTLYEPLIEHCKELGLTVKIMTPKEHDTFAAYSQFFSLVVRDIGKELGIKPTPIDTPGANAMLELLTYDFDKKIIEDMIRYNTYCKEVLEKMRKTITSLQQT